MENMGVGYKDLYEMPYGRRQRLVAWKQERIKDENERQQQSISRVSRQR